MKDKKVRLPGVYWYQMKVKGSLILEENSIKFIPQLKLINRKQRVGIPLDCIETYLDFDPSGNLDDNLHIKLFGNDWITFELKKKKNKWRLHQFLKSKIR